MTNWSLQRRVLTTSGVVVVLMIVLGVAAFAVTLDQILYRAALDTARSTAGQVVEVVAKGEASPGASLAEVPAQGAIVQLLGADGAVVASSDRRLDARPATTLRPAAGREEVDQSATVPGELGEPYAVLARGVADPQGATYAVVVAVPLSALGDTVRTATVLLAVGAVAMLVLLLVLVRRAVRQALQPVEGIRREVARISQVRGGGAVTVPPTGDEIARLAVTMNEMLDRLQRADAATRRFVSDASHELRSPLATIRAALEVSGRGEDDERDDLLRSETLRLQSLVDDLLTLAKADDGAPLVREEVDVDDIVEQEVRRVRARGVPVEADIGAARVLGDRARLEQMVRNVVDNALRHTTGAVGLSVETTGDDVVVRVDNDGPPVPAAERETVFDRFTRLEDSRRRESGGSGLGLAIVRTVAEAHGGTATATETAAGQCRFELRLPASATDTGISR
jgi:signal transduction histidine kinase